MHILEERKKTVVKEKHCLLSLISFHPFHITDQFAKLRDPPVLTTEFAVRQSCSLVAIITHLKNNMYFS